MMDWDKVLTLLHVATTAQDYPKLHDLRNKALDELEAMVKPGGVPGTPVIGLEANIEADTNGVRRA